LRGSARKVVSSKEGIANQTPDAEKPALLNFLDELAVRGTKGGDKSESFAAYAKIDDIQDYFPDGVVTGQKTRDTCAASSLNMVLNDLGIKKTEDILAEALDTVVGVGASIFRIPQALKRLDIQSVNAVSRQVRDISDYTAMFSNELKTAKGAIVSVKKIGLGAHAILVDKIVDGRVYIRDPYPAFYGSSYSIPIAEFDKIFNKKYVLLK
jgi:hypothetical protein